MNSEKYLFTYGTLMCDDIFLRVCGRAVKSVAARLDGYQRFRVAGQAYPAIVPRETKSVAGRLFGVIQPREFARLDNYEGEWYQRKKVDVLTDQGVVSAQTYVLHPQYSGKLEPRDWDFERFLREQKSGYLKRL